MAEPGVSQVITLRPDGTHPVYLGTLGHVSALVYSWANPGGADQLSCTLQCPTGLRTEALNPGRQCQVIRSARVIWDGKLVEPTPIAGGWQVTAVGLGHAGTDFAAVFGTWTNQNDAINQAIGRGLRWSNPGVPAGVWLGQVTDSGSMTVTDLLNLFCTLGGFTWYVSTLPRGGGSLSVYLFPAATLANANAVLVASSPPARTLGGDVNTIWVRYQSSADAATVATFGLTSVTTPGAAALHGVQESFVDLSSAGVMTAGQAQGFANGWLARYQRASYAAGFTVRYGELLTPGGAAADLGLDHCGAIVKVILAGGGYGGEVVPGPAVFMIGDYQWDQDAQTATVVPFQSLNQGITGLEGAGQALLGGQLGYWRGDRGGTAAQEKAPAPKAVPRRITVPARKPPPPRHTVPRR